MIYLEYEENFEVIIKEFKTFKDKNEWFNKNKWIFEKNFSLRGE